MLLEGDDLSVITYDGKNNVFKDKYGLEFPYRSRSPLQLIPKPIRNYIRQKLQDIKKSLHAVLLGFLRGLAPAKIVDQLQIKSIQLLKLIKKYVVIYIKKGWNQLQQQLTPKKPSHGSQQDQSGQVQLMPDKKAINKDDDDLIEMEDVFDI